MRLFMRSQTYTRWLWSMKIAWGVLNWPGPSPGLPKVNLWSPPASKT